MESIPSNKIKTLDWLINQIDENAHDLTIPKCGIFLGAGCSARLNITSVGVSAVVSTAFATMRSEPPQWSCRNGIKRLTQ